MVEFASSGPSPTESSEDEPLAFDAKTPAESWESFSDSWCPACMVEFLSGTEESDLHGLGVGLSVPEPALT